MTVSQPVQAKALRGRINHCAGIAAEDAVARRYVRAGSQVCARRWRGGAGEIDLIVRERGCVVFVEVKAARSFAAAATRINRRQIERLFAAATEFVAGEPSGQLTEMRFDVAMVDGHGDVRIMQNALMAM